MVDLLNLANMESANFVNVECLKQPIVRLTII